jgi:outer membrane lipoprotein-sorting protein
MRWLALLTLTLTATPALAEENAAEKLYRAMEKKVTGATTLAMDFTAGLTVADKQFNIKGTLHVAAGNKTRLQLESELIQFGGKTLIVTNGKAQQARVGERVVDEGPFPPKGEVLLALIARFGAAQAALERKIATTDLDKTFPASKFQLGALEQVGGRRAQVVYYQLQDKNAGDQADASVWIDTATLLPLKRVLVRKGKEASTETYRSFTVDGKLDDKLFEIPPK